MSGEAFKKRLAYSVAVIKSTLTAVEKFCQLCTEM